MAPTERRQRRLCNSGEDASTTTVMAALPQGQWQGHDDGDNASTMRATTPAQRGQ